MSTANVKELLSMLDDAEDGNDLQYVLDLIDSYQGNTNNWGNP